MLSTQQHAVHYGRGLNVWTVCVRACVCVRARVRMYTATDAGSVAQSHLTSEERGERCCWKRAMKRERERKRGEEKERGLVPGERESKREWAVCWMPSSMVLEWCCVERAGWGIYHCSAKPQYPVSVQTSSLGATVLLSSFFFSFFLPSTVTDFADSGLCFFNTKAVFVNLKLILPICCNYVNQGKHCV